MNKTFKLLSALAISTLFVSSAYAADSITDEAGFAKSILRATEGNSVSGMITFAGKSGEMKVSGEITGLTEGKHGFHIHQYGDCSAADAKSAGGHFNPKGTSHGAPGGDAHHVGDLGNITADAKGVAVIDLTVPFLSLSGDNSILGRSVVVHAKKDDLSSQPSGAAGARVACGAIYVAEKK